MLFLLSLAAACSSDPESKSKRADAGAEAGKASAANAGRGNGAGGAVSGGDSGGGQPQQAGAAGDAGAFGRYDFIQLTAGPRHNCARLLDGRVKCWGQNGGWLGLGDYVDRGVQPDQMGSALPPVDLGLGVVADAVAARDLSVCALLHSGALKCWGNNSLGELGQGDILPRGGEPHTMGDALPAIDLGERGPVVEVAMGANHVCARLADGNVLCWGSNGLGELGQGDTVTRGDEPGEMGAALAPVPLGSGRHAVQITVGMHHSCALLDDHSVKCWGQNNLGQLGLGDIQTRGDEPGEMGDALPTVNLGVGQQVRMVQAGQDFTCAILEDQRVKCWGINENGQLGNGDLESRGDVAERLGDQLPYTDLGQGFAAKSLSLGSYHACALSTNGAVKCWGVNTDGQLGLGNVESHGAELETMGDALANVDFGASRRALGIAVGSQHSCASLDDGKVVCWGNNSLGQLGVGDVLSRGTAAAQLGDAFVPTLLDE